MASAGMLTVTNSFENKTAEAMSAISSNLITAEPSLDGIADGLVEAADRVGEYDARRRQRVCWSRGWQESFEDQLMARIESFLEA